MKPEIHFHKGDLPADVQFTGSVAVDTEAMGLKLQRDKLCLVQLSAGDGICHLVQVDRDTYNAPNLKTLFANPNIIKIFHYARFDVAAIRQFLGVVCDPIYCTKIASKMVRTYSDRHGLKDLCHDILGIEISKHEQNTDWGSETLTEKQQIYAATDVLHLHKLRDHLNIMLAREDRTELAQACFKFLPVRAHLDLLFFNDPDIFNH